MASNREITGIFVRERNAFESDDGLTRTIIGEIEPAGSEGNEFDSGRITILGEAGNGELVAGLAYRFYGQHRDHHKYGPQFHFTGFVVENPAGQEAVETYLQSYCEGVGPVKANRAWKLWGDDAIRICREQPEVAAEELKISIDDAQASATFLTERLAVEKTTVELYGLLHGRGLPKFNNLVEKLIQDHGSQAALVIRRNPYLLMRYRGCGFLKTDKLWLEFGHNPARLKRQALCAWHAISNGNGDTWFPHTDARDALRENISGASVRFDDAMELALRAGMLVERDERGRLWIAEKRKADAEGRVARFIAGSHEESQEDGIRWPDLDSLQGIVSEHQFEQLSKALTDLVCVLAGSPGTGKTYCAAALIQLVIAAVGSNHVAACCPTGKAAVRLTEGLQENGVNLRATTIHSLLKVKSGGDDGWGFQHGADDPLPHEFVFIDEASMIDTNLMASLLSARGRGAHFLFIGDPNQLAPVGHGAPLRDMITVGAPTGTLTKIERNDGLIVRACGDIRDNRRFKPAVKPNLEAAFKENLVLIHRDTPEMQIDALTKLMGQFLDGKKHDPIWDVQILVAVNKKSQLGRKPLNEKLQDLLNPEGERVKGNPFRVGDKIINSKNGWLSSRIEFAEGANEQGKVYVANGEQAEVLAVEPNRTIAKLEAPYREVIIPRGNRSDEETEAAKSGGDDSEDTSTGTGCDWELGYAISVHKSQGSEWKFVIVMLDTYNGAKMVQSRQWLYTAISRAKKLCFLVGEQKTADDACRRDGLFNRKTFLVERIRELQNVAAITPAREWTDEAVSDLLAGVI